MEFLARNGKSIGSLAISVIFYIDEVKEIEVDMAVTCHNLTGIL